MEDPKHVGRIQPRGLTPFAVESEGKPDPCGWTVQEVSPKIYSWARWEGDSVRTSDPLKSADLKQGDVIYVETLFGIAKMEVEIIKELGEQQIMAVNEGLIGHILTDADGFAGCPVTINRKAIEKARQIVVPPDTTQNSGE